MQSDSPEKMVSRKNDHIEICARRNVESAQASLNSFETGLRTPSFSGVRFLPEALPELSFSDINTSCTFLGRTFQLPLMITGMTGGVEKGQEINQILGIAAQKFGIPMGLGSQKIMIARPDLRSMFDIRKKSPEVFLIGNMGAVSFNYGITLEDLKRLVDDLELSAFALHLNVLQECIQPEGERNFSGLLSKIEKVARFLPVPVLVKEVGSGMTGKTYARLAECGVAAVDVGGSGGTSWSAIEGMRCDAQGNRLGELFRNWGMSTEDSLRECVQIKKSRNHSTALVATGGIRNGMEVAKAVACGASMTGVGLPFFRKIVNPDPGLTALESLCNELEFFAQSLRITMFCAGAKKLGDLSSRVCSSPAQKDMCNDK